MWATGLPTGARWDSVGEVSGEGTTVTCGNGSKGSFVTIGTANFDWNGFWLDIIPANSAGYRIDVAIGAANTIIFPDMLLDARSSGSGQIVITVFIPLAVPAGTDISIAAQTTGGFTLRVLARGYATDENGPLPGSRITCLNTWSGVESDSAVTQTGSAASNTAWTEIIASTPHDISGIYIAGNQAGDSTRTIGRLIVDIAIGAVGSEQTVMSIQMPNNNNSNCGPIEGPYLLSVPAGSRLSWRVRGNTTMADTLGMAAWGFSA